jgi:hypothetical protein
MTVLTERKLRTLFRDQGFRVLQIRRGRHWVARVAKNGGRPLVISVSRSPSDFRFRHNFVTSLRRAERAAAEEISR